jgi:3-carboxy-cis,cis-muconate cycloisomerase
MAAATAHLWQSDAVERLFDEAALTRALLDVEAALAQAQAECGLIDAAAARAIGAACAAGLGLAPGSLLAEGRHAGSLAIPLVKHLTAAVAAAAPGREAYVHYASTSQDVLDTAMALQTRRALAAIDQALGEALQALLDLGARHAATPALARTLLQPAGVTSFGLRCARWAESLLNGRERMRQAASTALRVQLGGAVGTLAALEGRSSAAVARAMARRLGLPARTQGDAHTLTWHTRRDDWLALGAALAITCTSTGKIADDWALSMQAEVGELAEAEVAGRGGSSAMPHKRNPVATMLALGASRRGAQSYARLLDLQRHSFERSLGDWQLELAEWPALLSATHAALQSLAVGARGLRADPSRLRGNIEALHGLIFAESLAAWLTARGWYAKAEAQRQVSDWCGRAVREDRPLFDVAREGLAERLAAAPAAAAALEACFDIDRAAAAAAALANTHLRSLRQRARLALPIVPLNQA